MLEAHCKAHFEAIPEQKAYYSKQPNLSKLSISRQPKNLEEILKVYTEEVAETGLNCNAATNFGFFINHGLFASALADFVAALDNQFPNHNFYGPGIVAIEHTLLEWFKTIFGYPKSCLGNLTSGSSIGIIMAMKAARDNHNIKGALISSSVAYVTSETHFCFDKAFDLCGLSDMKQRMIPMDDGGRMLPEALKDQIEADIEKGYKPFLVVATAGTASIGAIDPIKAIGLIAREHGLWFHVDAATGGLFALVEPAKFDGIEMSNSINIDPHKTLCIPTGLGAVLINKPYIKTEDKMAKYHHELQETELSGLIDNGASISFELSRPFRGLRLWLPLQMYGIKPFEDHLKGILHLTGYFRKCLTEIGFQVGPEPDLTVSYFWYEIPENHDNFHGLLMRLIQEDGDVFLASLVVQGRKVLRFAVVSTLITEESINRAINVIQKCLTCAIEIVKATNTMHGITY